MNFDQEQRISLQNSINSHLANRYSEPDDHDWECFDEDEEEREQLMSELIDGERNDEANDAFGEIFSNSSCTNFVNDVVYYILTGDNGDMKLKELLANLDDSIIMRVRNEYWRSCGRSDLQE